MLRHLWLSLACGKLLIRKKFWTCLPISCNSPTWQLPPLFSTYVSLFLSFPFYVSHSLSFSLFVCFSLPKLLEKVLTRPIFFWPDTMPMKVKTAFRSQQIENRQNTRNFHVFNFIMTFISHFAIPYPITHFLWNFLSLSLSISLSLCPSLFLYLSLPLSLSLSLSLFFFSLSSSLPLSLSIYLSIYLSPSLPQSIYLYLSLLLLIGVSFYHMDYMAALSKANFGAHGYAASFVLSGMVWSFLHVSPSSSVEVGAHSHSYQSAFTSTFSTFPPSDFFSSSRSDLPISLSSSL